MLNFNAISLWPMENVIFFKHFQLILIKIISESIDLFHV